MKLNNKRWNNADMALRLLLVAVSLLAFFDQWAFAGYGYLAGFAMVSVMSVAFEKTQDTFTGGDLAVYVLVTILWPIALLWTSIEYFANLLLVADPKEDK